jgi:endonuclease YncB( thermonuclease family)
MFWRKKSDGFEWHKHIRTTIKLRREARKQKIDDVVDLAIGGIKDAGKAGATASVSWIDSINRVIALPFAWAGRAIAATLDWTSDGLARVLTPLGQAMERRGLAPLIGLIGAIAVLLGIGRAQVDGWDGIALALALCGLGMIVAVVGPPILAGRGPVTLTVIARRSSDMWTRVPGLGGTTLEVQRGLTAIALVAVVGLAGWLGSSWIGSLSMNAVSAIPGLSRPVVEGTASALAGDRLRLDGRAIRLAGVEAPEIDQDCGGQGREKRWRCGETARAQLRDLVRGKQVRCEIASDGERGLCRVASTDIAAELVARGHIFAQQGLFSSYGRLEQDARNQRLGLWRGSAERPHEYRNRLWEAAKKRAPQGCPIKAQITRKDRVYLVPWQAGYSRVRVREDRGERWFCSEQEAQAAGFKRQGV